MTRDAIYELLIQKIMPHLRDSLTTEEITNLDGILWTLARTIAEAPQKSQETDSQ
jgi:hypothetical protein